MAKEKKIKNKLWNVIFGTKGMKAFPVGEGRDEDFYDNCPICQLLKRCKEEGREPSEAELHAAFEQAKEEGGIVGSEWIKENNKET